MRMYDIIDRKKRGAELSKEEIEYFIKEYSNGRVPDYQASALLMAICINGMNLRETTDLTNSMAHSGDMLDLSGIDGTTADKHSTGGVGDKTSLAVAPICAACSLKIAKMSGRGLGHTGGTVDKLESITGYKTKLSNEEFFNQVNKIGIAIIGQTGNLAPADKKLYALRDVTATVDNYSLIAASIMSKKLAAGDKNIVLDVKCGSGAFMKTPEDAQLLAEAMVDIGKRNGRNIAAVITNMDIPLGKNIGNSLEVKEAVEILCGSGDKELSELCVVLAANMLSISFGKDFSECEAQARQVIDNGAALEKLKQMVIAQGGDVRLIENPDLFPQAKIIYEIKSPFEGYISYMDARKIGECAVILGAGRETKDDKIELSAGIVLERKTGDKVSLGDTLAYFHTSSEEKAKLAEKLYFMSVKVDSEKPQKKQLIFKTIR